MKKLVLTTLVVTAAYLMSCEPEDSADVNQDRIWTAYELFYNENNDKTIAIARFKFGNSLGTLLELNDPAVVRFNGDELSYNPIYAGHAREYAGKLTSGTFEYVNVDGEVFTNIIPTLNEIAFPDNFTTITKGQANSFKWDGTALAGRERVNVFVGSWTWGDDAAIFTTGAGLDEVVMGSDQVDDLPLGPATCHMDRVNAAEATEVPEAGGEVRTRYKASNVPVEVAE